MITAAKTSADHEKLAAHYEQEAKAARAKAEEHRKMADATGRRGALSSRSSTSTSTAMPW